MISVTQTHALIAGIVQSYGSITPQFNSLDVFVDFGGEFGNLTIEVFAQGGAGGVNTRVANVRVGRNGRTDPNTALAISSIGVQGSTTYSIQITSDKPFVAVKASMVGYDAQVNNQPDEIVTQTNPLITGVEVSFGLLNKYHIYVQADVDFGPVNSNTESIWRLYGIAGVAGGGVRTKLFEKRLSANPNGQGRIQTIISLPNDFNPVGCDTFELTAQAVNTINAGDSSPTATLIGFDPNLNIIVAPGGPPTGPAGGYLGGNYPNPTVVASPTLIYKPGGIAVANVYNTWAALMAAFLLTVGPINIAIDGSSVAGGIAIIPAITGVSDLQSRVTLFALNPGAFPTLNISDGAQLKNINSISGGGLTIQGNGSIINPLFYDATANGLLTILDSPNFSNTGAAALISWNNGNFWNIEILNGFSYSGSGAGVGAFVGIPANGSLQFVFYDRLGVEVSLGANSFISGPVTATLGYVTDGTWGPTNFNSPSFLGTVNPNTQITKTSKSIIFIANGNFTWPEGVTEVDLEGIGGAGGGGGGHGGSGINGTSGAGGGGALRQKITITGQVARTVTPIVIGAGGLGGAGGAAAANGVVGNPGAATTFGVLAKFDPGSGGSGGTLGNASPGLPYINDAGNMVDAVSIAGNGTSIFQGAGGRGGADGLLGFPGMKNGGLFAGGIVGIEGVGGGAIGHGGGGGGAGPYGAGAAGGAGGNTLVAGSNGVNATANSGAGGGGGGGGGGAGVIGGNGGNGGSGFLKVTWRISP